MKKIVFLIFISLLFVAELCFGQKIILNKYDRYTKKHKVETSVEVIKVKLVNALRYRVIRSDRNLYIELKPTFHSAFAVREGDEAIFLFKDDVTISLKCVRGGVADYDSYKGSTFWYGSFLYKVEPSDYDILVEKDLQGVRIELGDEYYVFDGVKEKNVEKIKKAFQLVNNDMD